MILIKPSVEVLKMDDIKLIEAAGRTCYKSEDKITEGSAKDFVRMLVGRGHEAMIEHAVASVKATCDRGTSHEIVRHRLFSFAQESTRYCNYNKEKFDNQCTFIIPTWMRLQEGYYRTEFNDYNDAIFRKKDNSQAWSTSVSNWAQLINGKVLRDEIDNENHLIFLKSLLLSEKHYNDLINRGWAAQQARAVLPNSLKTEIVITGNFREWRHFFKLRCDKAAHPQMREMANMILERFVALCPDMIWR